MSSRVCAECGESKPAQDFRYTMNSRSYGDRCSECRNTPKIKCERCHERESVDHYGVKSSGERRRICNTCLGHGKTPLSRQIVAIHEMLDSAGVGDKSQPVEQRVALMIRRERVAVGQIRALMKRFYKNAK